MRKRAVALALAAAAILAAAVTAGVIIGSSRSDGDNERATGRTPAAATTPSSASDGSSAASDGGDCQPAADIYEQVRPAVVRIVNRGASSQFGFPQEGSGSGVVIDADGTILTNRHVVDGAETLEVTFADGTTVSARVVGTDPGNDLAVVQADLGGYQPSVAKL